MSYESYQYPSTLDHSEDLAFLPQNPESGFVGFYPMPARLIGEIPAPLRALSFREEVKAIRCNISFQAAVNYKEKPCFNFFSIELPVRKVIKHLFMLTGVNISSMEILFKDGSRTWAEWVQDLKTGAFAISAKSRGKIFVKQGGFENHMSEGVYFDQKEKRWQFDRRKIGSGQVFGGWSSTYFNSND